MLADVQGSSAPPCRSLCRSPTQAPARWCHRHGVAGSTVTLAQVVIDKVLVHRSKEHARSCFLAQASCIVLSSMNQVTRHSCRQLSLICVLLNLRRARLIDLIDAALDGPQVPRRFPQSTPLQHFQEPCEWQTRWQMSSPSSRRPIDRGKVAGAPARKRFSRQESQESRRRR